MATGHIDDDRLELYALNRLPEPEAAPVEEHLLVCEECRERLAGWDVYVVAMRGAMAREDTATSRGGGCLT
jgi:anti-sigma factor RsiW